jgi:glycosyltransferase involved in cell wall biosynthesis
MNHMQDLSVSVVIPNRNGAATLGLCLEAALACRYPDFEVLVVDDASRDNSVEVVRKFPCRLIRLARHGGAARARNAGAAHARGAILFFTDADCLLPPDALTRAVEALTARAAAVGGSYTPLPHDHRFFSRFQSVFVHYFETRRPHAPDYLATHALAISTRVFREHGGFDEDLRPILEDVEFSHRLRRAGCRLVMDPALQVRHVFNFSLCRSLRNAFVKSLYWTRYSLKNGDLLADSGTAARAFKVNVAALFLGAPLFILGAIGNALWLLPAGAVTAVNLFINRGLFRAFVAAGGWRFALAAACYYLLIYPLPVAAGAGLGAVRHVGALLHGARGGVACTRRGVT